MSRFIISETAFGRKRSANICGKIGRAGSEAKGAKITEQNIKGQFGRRWAWKMGKLFRAVAFAVGDWQDKTVQDEIEKHNWAVRVSWLSSGGDPARECWWHVTEITLDHFRASPKWIREGQDLALAKKREAAETRGLKALAERQRKEEEKLRMLREVAEEFRTNWPGVKNHRC